MVVIKGMFLTWEIPPCAQDTQVVGLTPRELLLPRSSSAAHFFISVCSAEAPPLTPVSSGFVQSPFRVCSLGLLFHRLASLSYLDMDGWKFAPHPFFKRVGVNVL